MKSGSAAIPAWVYALLSFAVICVYWIPRLAGGFWVDETGSFWIAHKGFAHVWENLQIYPGQSVVYMHLVSLFTTTGPYKELMMRIPSVAAALVAARILHVLTEQIAGKGSGYLAVIPFLSAGGIVEAATNARPYALGLAVILASFLSLRHWVRTSSTRQYVIYCVTSSFVVYLHYLFGLIFLAQAIYLVAARRAGRRVPWGRVCGAALFIGAAAVPLAWQMLTIARLAGAWTTLRPPDLASFFLLFPTQPIIVVAIGLALYRFRYPHWFQRPSWLAVDDATLLFMWMLLGPAIVFTTARITGYVIFTQRYLIYALLPCFVFIAWALRQVNNEPARLAVLLGLSLNAFVYIFTLRQPEWRTPLEAAATMAGPETPLLVQSGFAESFGIDLRGEPKNSSYLFAPLTAYPVPNRVIPVPINLTADSRRLVIDAVEQQASSHRKFGLLTIDGTNAETILSSWFQAKGYRPTTYRISGFTLITFEQS